MIKVFSTIALVLVFHSLNAQNCYAKFTDYCQEGDTANIRLLLKNWNKTDPEYYTSAFNYFIMIGKKEVISLDDQPNDKGSFVAIDSLNNINKYLNSTILFDVNSSKNAIRVIDNGIKQFPNRLDMRFGKCKFLFMQENFKKFTDVLIETINYSSINGNNWKWTLGKKLPNGKEQFINDVYVYLTDLYNTEDDNLLSNIIKIGEASLALYPDDVKILSITAVASILSKNNNKAIKHLKKALSLNPNDYIVLNNLAESYERIGDKINAVKYYKIILKRGPSKEKIKAKSRISELEK